MYVFCLEVDLGSLCDLLASGLNVYIQTHTRMQTYTHRSPGNIPSQQQRNEESRNDYVTQTKHGKLLPYWRGPITREHELDRCLMCVCMCVCICVCMIKAWTTAALLARTNHAGTRA